MVAAISEEGFTSTANSKARGLFLLRIRRWCVHLGERSAWLTCKWLVAVRGRRWLHLGTGVTAAVECINVRLC
jgi:hypothetical protein